MMKYTPENNESGMALIFAIGLLALLLLVGLAFVGNSINYRKVAENNNARSQARMFALSAVSRAASSLQIFSHQFIKHDASHEPPKSFDHIFSYAKYDNDGKVSASGSNEFFDGLVGEFSLMLLPTNSSVLSTQRAQAFNNRFLGKNWAGRWVFFTNGQSGADRRIIGRAAWQVVGSPADILAPVFMRGGITVDPYYDGSSEDFRPNENRWGREIDEVVLPTAVFPRLGSVISNYESEVTTIESIYEIADAAGDSEDQMRRQRWLESWFIPDFGGGTVGNPTMTSFTETYAVGRYSRLRFNISELNDGGHDWKNNREGDSVYNGLDQWYARFGITSADDANSDKAVTMLTADSLFWRDYSSCLYDYDIEDAFNGLPFLRRIGDVRGTFANLGLLRKQIAANFNDYCDTDGIPTSDVAAKNWLALLGTDDPNPTYTGNEETPYLYEIGMNFGIASTDAASKIVSATPVAATPGSYIIGAQIMAAPVVKLCNIYPFDPAGGMYENFGTDDFLRAYVDFGALDIKFKIRKASLKEVEFAYTVTIETVTETTVTGTDSEGNPTKTTSTETQTVTEVRTFKIDSITLANLNGATPWNTQLTENFDFNGTTWQRTADTAVNGAAPIDPVVFAAGDVDNSSGSNPYPWKRGVADNPMWQKAELPDASRTFAYSLGEDDLFNVTAGVAELKDDVTLGTVEGTGTYHGDLAGYKDALIGTSTSTETSTTPDAKTTVKTTVTTTFSNPVIQTQPSAISVDQIVISKIDFAGIRRAILTARIDGDEVGVDFVGSLPGATFPTMSREIDLPDAADAATQKGLVYSSYRNFDPRQNLNQDDWLHLGALLEVPDFIAPGYTEYSTTSPMMMYVDYKNNGIANSDGDAPYDFVPFPASEPSDRDAETAAEPAYTSSSDRISTAVIRNAPMMSPWEIGFIHRGIRWQTINIKDAGFTNFSDNDDAWDNPGSSYTGGDGAILEQIKMSDRIHSYGKININRLHHGDANFAANLTENQAIARAFLSGVVYGENPLGFIIDSTRDASTGRFPSTPSAITGGAELDDVDDADLDDSVENFIAQRSMFSRRIDFLEYNNGGFCLENGFSTPISDTQNTDAAQEEFIGKTINLLAAYYLSPNLVYVVVVAQSIRDRAGEQVQLTTETDISRFTNGSGDIEDGVVTMECEYGRFDYFHHESEDPARHVYFDEITGEVKMFVQLYHDTTTGRLTIQKIDYL